MTSAAIELREVAKQLGNFSLGPVTLEVPRGAIFALIGPNGAGKSTMIDLMMGMGRPDGGDIRLLGNELSSDEVAIKRLTAYVGPDLSYQPWGTVGRALDFVSGFYPDWNRERCERLQADFKVHRDERIAALSFGARIKLALIMALSRETELLLLDEPTVGLDAIARRQLFSQLLAFMQNEGRTIFISSHQLSDLERFADHVAIINQGRLLTAGPMDELIEAFRQIEVRTRGNAIPAVEGVYVVRCDDESAALVVRRDLIPQLQSAGLEVIAQLPLTLEELFISLVGTADMQTPPGEGR